MVFFLIAFGVWLLTTPIVNAVLSFCGEQVVLFFDGYGLTQKIDSAGKNILVHYAPSPDGRPFVMNYRNITFNTVFLLALLMAVPDVDRRLRTKIVLLGLLFLFPVQVFRFAVVVFNYYGQHMQMDGQSLYAVWLRKGLWFTDRIVARLDGQAIPLLIWAGLYFYYQWYYRLFKRAPWTSGRAKSRPKC